MSCLLQQCDVWAAYNKTDMRIVICFRKSEVTVERMSDCNVIEKMMVHDIRYLPCSYTNTVIDLLPKQL